MATMLPLIGQAIRLLYTLNIVLHTSRERSQVREIQMNQEREQLLARAVLPQLVKGGTFIVHASAQCDEQQLQLMRLTQTPLEIQGFVQCFSNNEIAQKIVAAELNNFKCTLDQSLIQGQEAAQQRTQHMIIHVSDYCADSENLGNTRQH